MQATEKIRSRLGSPLGIVSNCWRIQLANGQSLESLIECAVEQGYRFIELRQGDLGEFASIAAPGANPSIELRSSWSALHRRFPEIQFNLAISLPCFSGELQGADPRFLNAIEASRSLKGEGQFHLRLVDTETRVVRLTDSTKSQSLRKLIELARQVALQGGTLSIEHAYQCWDDFRDVVCDSRMQLGEDSGHLRICFDPCNLLLTEPAARVAEIVSTIDPALVSMIHIKQRRDGQIQPDLEAGDLDWNGLLQSLERQGHAGPWLFEIAPHDLIWEQLDKCIHALEFRAVV